MISSFRHLKPGNTSMPILVQHGWGGRIWNNSTQMHANTLAEFFIDDVNSDYYDISIVDGFDIGMSITPFSSECSTLKCTFDTAICPSELLDHEGGPCLSACTKYGAPDLCCTGLHNTPETCPANELSLYFKKLCPEAYTYAFDDPTSIRTCNDAPSYEVTMCP